MLEDFAARGMGGRWMAMQDQELFFSRDARQPLEAGRGEMLGPRRAAPDLAAGFTLLELVLVLVIVGIGFSVVAPALGERMSARRARQVAHELRAAMEYERIEAIRSGGERVLIVDPEKNAYWIGEDRVIEIPPRDGRLLPKGRSTDDQGRVGFHFYPDGVTSGGEVVLERVRGLSRLRYRVRLDPLLGTATISQGGEEPS